MTRGEDYQQTIPEYRLLMDGRGGGVLMKSVFEPWKTTETILDHIGYLFRLFIYFFFGIKNYLLSSIQTKII